MNNVKMQKSRDGPTLSSLVQITVGFSARDAHLIDTTFLSLSHDIRGAQPRHEHRGNTCPFEPAQDERPRGGTQRRKPLFNLNIQICECPSMRTSKYANVDPCECPNVRIFKCMLVQDVWMCGRKPRHVWPKRWSKKYDSCKTIQN